MSPIFNRIFSSRSHERALNTGNSHNKFSSKAPSHELCSRGFFHRFKVGIVALTILATSVVGCSSSGVESYSSLIGPKGGSLLCNPNK